MQEECENVRESSNVSFNECKTGRSTHPEDGIKEEFHENKIMVENPLITLSLSDHAREDDDKTQSHLKIYDCYLCNNRYVHHLWLLETTNLNSE